MAMYMAVKGFLPAVGHLDRPLRSQRQQASMDLHADILARPEGAADAGEVKAHLFRWQIEARGQLLEIRVQPLGRDEEIDAAVGGGNCQARLGTEGRLVLHARLVRPLYPDVGGRAGVAMDDREGAHDVALRMHRWRRRFERLLHVGHGGEDLVVDGDCLQRGARQLGVFGGDDGNRLAGIPNHIRSQHRLVLHIETKGFLAGHIGVGQDGADAWCHKRRRRVDRDDLCVGMRAAQRRAPQHPVAAEVAGVFELALHLGNTIHTPYRLTDAALPADVDAHVQIMLASLRFTSCPSWTTGFPSTKRCCTGPGLQKTSAATGSASAPRWGSPSTVKRAISARLPAWIEPTSSRPRQAAPPRVATRSASRAVIAAGPFRPLVVSIAWRASASRFPLSFEAEPSTASPTGTPAP